MMKENIYYSFVSIKHANKQTTQKKLIFNVSYLKKLGPFKRA